MKEPESRKDKTFPSIMGALVGVFAVVLLIALLQRPMNKFLYYGLLLWGGGIGLIVGRNFEAIRSGFTSADYRFKLGLGALIGAIFFTIGTVGIILDHQPILPILIFGIFDLLFIVSGIALFVSYFRAKKQKSSTQNVEEEIQKDNK